MTDQSSNFFFSFQHFSETLVKISYNLKKVFPAYQRYKMATDACIHTEDHLWIFHFRTRLRRVKSIIFGIYTILGYIDLWLTCPIGLFRKYIYGSQHHCSCIITEKRQKQLVKTFTQEYPTKVFFLSCVKSLTIYFQRYIFPKSLPYFPDICQKFNLDILLHSSYLAWKFPPGNT